MKNRFLNIRSLFFICLYLWYVGQIQTSFAIHAAEQANLKDSKQYFSKILAKETFRFTHFQTSATETGVVSEQSYIPFKHHFTDASEESRFALRVIETKIRNYLDFSSILYRFSSTDIIYPFHYFW